MCVFNPYLGVSMLDWVWVSMFVIGTQRACLCNTGVCTHITGRSVCVCLCMLTCIPCTPVHMCTFESGSLEPRSLSHVLGTCGLCGRGLTGMGKLTGIPLYIKTLTGTDRQTEWPWL